MEISASFWTEKEAGINQFSDILPDKNNLRIDVKMCSSILTILVFQ
jgi:hypothetical protein